MRLGPTSSSNRRGLSRKASPSACTDAVGGLKLLASEVPFTVQGLFLAGCGAPKGANSSFCDLSSAVDCASHPSMIYEHLSVLSFPGLAIACFAAGWILTSWGVVIALGCMRRESAHLVHTDCQAAFAA
jgi:hypothetical protein